MLQDVLGGAGGGLGDLFRQAQQLQEQLQAAQATAAGQEVTGQAGGGVVKVTVTGALEFLSVHIDPEVVDPADVGMLEDLVLAAIHDATERARRIGDDLAQGLIQLPGTEPLTTDTGPAGLPAAPPEPPPAEAP